MMLGTDEFRIADFPSSTGLSARSCGAGTNRSTRGSTDLSLVLRIGGTGCSSSRKSPITTGLSSGRSIVKFSGRPRARLAICYFAEDFLIRKRWLERLFWPLRGAVQHLLNQREKLLRL